MNTPTTLPPPSHTAPRTADRPKTRQFARWQLLLARFPPFLLMPVIFLLGLGVGVAVVLSVQRAHGVVATVNGLPIRSADFYHRLELAAGPQVLQQMAHEEAQLQFAQKQGVLPTDADVNAQLAEMRLQPSFAQNMKASRQTEEDVRHALLVSMAGDAVVTKGQSITDAEVQQFYQKNIDPKNPQARYYTPEATQVAVIITPDQKTASQALSDMAAGMSFAQAAAKYSQNPSKTNGGALPVILKGRSNLGKLEDLLFSMQVGQQRNMVQIGSTWWIIRCIGHSAPVTQPFDRVKVAARRATLFEKGLASGNGKAMDQDFKDFETHSDIKPVWPQYQPAGK